MAVFDWRAGAVNLPPLVFENSECGLGDFARYSSSGPSIPAYFLVDVVEEEFREETIPHAMGADRWALLRNRQNRLFRESSHSGAIIQGREKDGRRDDIVLFSALIRPELVTPWLARLTEAKVPLIGIYSVPVLSPGVLKKIQLRTHDVLLVTLQESGGLRQSYIRRGHLKVSRLAMAPRLAPGQQASYILTEIATLRRYLNSLRMFDSGTAMDIVILAGGSLLDDLRRMAVASEDVHLQVLDLNDVGRGLGMRTPVNSSYADALFAHLLAHQAPPNYYGRSEDTRYINHHRARLAMSAMSIITVLASIAFSGFRFGESVLTHHDAASISEQAVFYEKRYHAGKQGLTGLYKKVGLPEDIGLSPMELRQAVQLVEQLKAYRAHPWPTLVALSRGLKVFDAVRIERIVWGTSIDPQAQLSERGSILSDPNARFAVVAPSTQEAGVYFHLARVSGRIEPFDGDYRDALDQVNRFAGFLSQLDGVHGVEIRRQPFNASSRNRLLGNVAGARAAARFELRLVLKIGGKADAAG
ncbi:MAG: hypothetical protein GKR94_33115 [Gammaproteobacteria bacterium]|nr:hypothetical protein [Gammaproteobacteria bacterium]